MAKSFKDSYLVSKEIWDKVNDISGDFFIVAEKLCEVTAELEEYYEKTNFESRRDMKQVEFVINSLQSMQKEVCGVLYPKSENASVALYRFQKEDRR